jgi:hypothetical protein
VAGPLAGSLVSLARGRCAATGPAKGLERALERVLDIAAWASEVLRDVRLREAAFFQRTRGAARRWAATVLQRRERLDRLGGEEAYRAPTNEVWLRSTKRPLRRGPDPLGQLEDLGRGGVPGNGSCLPKGVQAAEVLGDLPAHKPARGDRDGHALSSGRRASS